MSAEQIHSNPKSATLIVRPPREAPPKVGGLVGLFKLHKYGSSLLTPATLSELWVMAWILLIVFVFEVVVWTSFFNVVLNRDVAYWGPGLPAAAAAACPFIAAVLFFERGILMLDSDRRWRLWIAAIFRIALILITVFFVTSTAFELWFFRPAILDRAGQEAVRTRVVAVWTKIASLSLDSRHSRSNDATSQHLEELQRARKNAWEIVVKAEENVAWIAARLVELKDATPPGAGNAASQDASNLKKTLAAREAVRDGAKQELKRIDQRIESFEGHRRADEEEDYKRRKDSAKKALDLKNQLQTCIGELLTTEGDRKCKIEGFHEDPKVPDFLDQRRILGDLAEARPPLWLGISETERIRIVTELGFPDLVCESTKTDSVACRQLDAVRDSYWNGHWLSQILGGLIPILMVVFKLFLLPDEVRYYYSRRHQAAAGNFGARHLSEVDATVHGKGAVR
jgi:hypothetical protein